MSATVGDPRAASVGVSPTRPAVSVDNVRKTFRLPHEQYHTLKERALHPFRKREFETLTAVDDVTVQIAQGEFFGIVGRNGSGKSTLLKCLAGIYGIDSGAIEIHGRLSPFIELGVGFNPDLTARDNVIINAIMLGLSRKQALARFDDILAFAELEEFIDLKLKNFSSGMFVRLAFATAIQVDAEILLIDEVLAVGDAAFQQKCFDEFARLKAAGRTILFVTHDMGAVEHFCDRAMLLERGRVVDIAEPSSIARQYNDVNFHRVREEAKQTGGPAILRRAPIAEVLAAYFESAAGEATVTARQSLPCSVRMDVKFHAPSSNPIFGISLRNDRGQVVYASSTYVTAQQTGSYQAGDLTTVRFRFENLLAPGRYGLVATVAREGAGADLHDLHADSSVIVVGEGTGGGIVDLPTTVTIDRG